MEAVRTLTIFCAVGRHVRRMTAQDDSSINTCWSAHGRAEYVSNVQAHRSLQAVLQLRVAVHVRDVRLVERHEGDVHLVREGLVGQEGAEELPHLASVLKACSDGF